jgi:hypothetical protein
MTKVITGSWQAIDENSKTLPKCMVRNGSASAWGRWHKTRWVYYPPGTNESLDFIPKEYRRDN